tara:strand:+ start:1917 stop:2444 length:528 start_codon:yes stop_codon:yes gene_type:complete
MACLNLASGRSLGCKNNVGGLKNIYFSAFAPLGETIVEGEVTVITETPVLYKYEIKGNSSLETSITSSRENGTTFYTSTLNLTLPILDRETQQQIKILAADRPIIFVEDYNGKLYLVGLENGAEVTGGTIVTGAAMGDLSGFTLTLEAQEKEPPLFVAPSLIASFIASETILPNA